MAEDQQVTFKVNDGDAAATLAEMMDVDVSTVEENYGWQATPAGTYHFRVKDARIGTREMAADRNHPDVRVNRATYEFTFEIMNVLALKDPALNGEDLIGGEHMETWAVFDFEKDTGKVKALFKESGFVPTTNKLGAMLDEFIGHEFQGVVKERKDRNDPDRKYANLDLRAIVPMASGQSAPQAQPTPAAAPAAGGFKLGG